MPPQFFDAGQPVQHPLEVKFNASAWDILCAIEKGFRAQVDVKGKLAEWFLYRVLDIERETGLFTTVEWSDVDGQPDFRLVGSGFDLRMECKNLRSGEKYADGSYKLETQKTRNQKTDDKGEEGTRRRKSKRKKGTRFYKVTEFDIVAACLFNMTGKWEYAFIRTVDLARHDTAKDCLKTMQRVPSVVQEPWKATLREVLTLFTEKPDATAPPRTAVLDQARPRVRRRRS